MLMCLIISSHVPLRELRVPDRWPLLNVLKHLRNERVHARSLCIRYPLIHGTTGELAPAKSVKGTSTSPEWFT